MKLFDRYNIEHNFPRGVFLPPLGEIPPLQISSVKELSAKLHIPIVPDNSGRYEIKTASAEQVDAGALLACGLVNVFSPCSGKMAGLTQCFLPGRGECPAVIFQPEQRAFPALYDDDTPQAINPDSVSPEQIIEQIRQAAIVSLTGEPLADILTALRQQPVAAVLANAAPQEPQLNSPAAILSCYPEKVYAGLAIVRHVLQARAALLAYPWHLDIDRDFAEIWNVAAVPVSEKYPQYHPQALSQTLRRRGIIQSREMNAIFDIQSLALIERAVMAHLPAAARIVTLAGAAAHRPGHYLVPIGFALTELLTLAGLDPEEIVVIAGGSLTGQALDPQRTVIGPWDQNYTVMAKEQMGAAAGRAAFTQPQRCIRCGRCVEFCPALLDPARLNDLIETGKVRQARREGLADCLHCGLCSYCCPAKLNIHENIIMSQNSSPY